MHAFDFTFTLCPPNLVLIICEWLSVSEWRALFINQSILKAISSSNHLTHSLTHQMHIVRQSFSTNTS